MTMIRGSSNAKAKRLLEWKPQLASWRQGFRLLRENPPVDFGAPGQTE